MATMILSLNLTAVMWLYTWEMQFTIIFLAWLQACSNALCRQYW